MFEGVTWLQWSTNEQYTVQPGRREIKSDLHVLSTPQQGAERWMPRKAAPSQSLKTGAWILRVGHCCCCCCWNDILFGHFFWGIVCLFVCLLLFRSRWDLLGTTGLEVSHVIGRVPLSLSGMAGSPKTTAKHAGDIPNVGAHWF